MAAARIEVYAQWKLPRRQRWYWRLLGGNSEIVASSEAYSSKDNAVRGAQDMQRIVREGGLEIRLVEGRR